MTHDQFIKYITVLYISTILFFLSVDSKSPVVTCSFTILYTMYLYFNTKIFISVFSYSKIDKRDCWKGLDCTITQIVNTVIKLYGLRKERI